MLKKGFSIFFDIASQKNVSGNSEKTPTNRMMYNSFENIACCSYKLVEIFANSLLRTDFINISVSVENGLTFAHFFTCKRLPVGLEAHVFQLLLVNSPLKRITN